MKRLRCNSYAVLLASLFIGIGAWGTNHTNWHEVATPQSAFELIGLFGSILLAWIGKSPIDGIKKE